MTALALIDHFSLLYIVMTLLTTFVLFAMSKSYFSLRESHPEEYYVLLLLAAAGGDAPGDVDRSCRRRFVDRHLPAVSLERARGMQPCHQRGRIQGHPDRALRKLREAGGLLDRRRPPLLEPRALGVGLDARDLVAERGCDDPEIRSALVRPPQPGDIAAVALAQRQATGHLEALRDAGKGRQGLLLGSRGQRVAGQEPGERQDRRARQGLNFCITVISVS